MPQRRRCAHGFPHHARRARDLRLDLGAAARALAFGLAACVGTAAAANDVDDVAKAFAGEAFCLFIPPEPIPGVFEPAPSLARAFRHDHATVLRLESALRRATTESVVTLAPSEPFDAAMIEAGGPMLERIMYRLLWLDADYWKAARRVLVDQLEAQLPTLGLEPLRRSCSPAVTLFVFTDETGAIGAAGYISLLTGRVMADWSR